MEEVQTAKQLAVQKLTLVLQILEQVPQAHQLIQPVHLAQEQALQVVALVPEQGLVAEAPNKINSYIDSQIIP